MAQTDPMTLQDLQDQINTLVSNDSDTPASDGSDDEWTTRLNLIYAAIRVWGTSKDVLWNELWTTYTHGSTLTATTTVTLTALLDYRFPGGYLRLTLNGSTKYIPIIKSENAQTYIAGGKLAAYITGSAQAGWTLNFTATPTNMVGATIVFDYYRFPYKPTAVGNKVEMSDPNFIVFWVAAQKALLESQNNKYKVYDSQAEESMDNMVIMNDLLPDYQNNGVENTDALNGAVLGE